ncbi:MAG: hypothetical protein HN348_34375, partial [Proteobacteria bacterium]|nr:hypothetical protein [Pseudomonadota bacterium]
GDRHLRAAMNRHRIPIGSEESGHVLFSDLVAGDGVITGIRVLKTLDEPTSASFDGFSPLPRQKAEVRVSLRPPLEEVAELVEYQRVHQPALGQGGRIFLRYSGTEPLLRVLVEGESESLVKQTTEEVTQLAAEVLR